MSTPQTSLQSNVAAKMFHKRDAAAEEEALNWLFAVVGLPAPPAHQRDLHGQLCSGQLLCRVINTLQPGSVKSISTSESSFKEMENINKFTEACRKYGVPDHDLFQTVDLYERKDLNAVVGTIFALGRTAHTHPEWKGPLLGPAPATASTREWTEDELRASSNVIGLQAGSNKGASQAGDNYGAGRKPIFGK